MDELALAFGHRFMLFGRGHITTGASYRKIMKSVARIHCSLVDANNANGAWNVQVHKGKRLIAKCGSLSEYIDSDSGKSFDVESLRVFPTMHRLGKFFDQPDDAHPPAPAPPHAPLHHKDVLIIARAISAEAPGEGTAAISTLSKAERDKISRTLDGLVEKMNTYEHQDISGKRRAGFDKVWNDELGAARAAIADMPEDAPVIEPPDHEPMAEMALDLVPAPEIEPIAEPMREVESVLEPITEPIAEPTVEPLVGSVAVEPVAEPVAAEPVAVEPASEKVVSPMDDAFASFAAASVVASTTTVTMTASALVVDNDDCDPLFPDGEPPLPQAVRAPLPAPPRPAPRPGSSSSSSSSPLQQRPKTDIILEKLNSMGRTLGNIDARIPRVSASDERTAERADLERQRQAAAFDVAAAASASKRLADTFATTLDANNRMHIDLDRSRKRRISDLESERDDLLKERDLARTAAFSAESERTAAASRHAFEIAHLTAERNAAHTAAQTAQNVVQSVSSRLAAVEQENHLLRERLAAAAMHFSALAPLFSDRQAPASSSSFFAPQSQHQQQQQQQQSHISGITDEIASRIFAEMDASAAAIAQPAAELLRREQSSSADHLTPPHTIGGVFSGCAGGGSTENAGFLMESY